MMDTNSSEISTDITPEAEELIEGFRSLVMHKTITVETLEKIEKFFSNEVERLSVSADPASLTSISDELATTDEPTPDGHFVPIAISKHTDTIGENIEITPDVNLPISAVPKNITTLNNLITARENFFLTSDLERVKIDVDRLFSVHDVKYIWLSKSHRMYQFGNWSLDSHQICLFGNLVAIMENLNNDLNLELDSCLISRYTRPSDVTPRHQDNEDIIDQEHPICNVSIGCPRDIEFWTTRKEGTGDLVKRFSMQHGSLVIMEPGCQQQLWHKVLKGEDGLRYCLSFRRTSPLKLTLTPEPMNLHFSRVVAQSTPIPTTMPGSSPRRPPIDQATPQLPHRSESFARKTLPLPIRHLQDGYQELPPNTPDSPGNKTFKHLVIGDSLVKGLNIPGCLHICKGGIHPKQVLPLLQASTEDLHPNCYHEVRTLTLIVGTNALNVNRFSKPVPLLEVIANYKKLVCDLKELFPNAHIGLFNIIPRAYNCPETPSRIEQFNTLFSRYISEVVNGVTWIYLYWEFIDNYGYLREDLYGRGGVHLSVKGKKLMSNVIMGFQDAYY